MDIEELLLRAGAKGYHDLSILNDRVVGFYKTKIVKYENPKGTMTSYLFPTTFHFEKDNVIVHMLLGSVKNNFKIPDNSNIKNATDYDVVLKIVNVGNHTYKHLIAQQTNKIPKMINGRRSPLFMHQKILTFVILGLSQTGFPFIQITDGSSLQEDPHNLY